MIVGSPGSGKSTLAPLMAARTGLPVVHMDHIHWKPGWVPRGQEEKDRLTREVHAREEWIFEGGHSRTYPERLERADTFIWLDLPLWLRILRVIFRTFRDLNRQRPDLPENCPERLNAETVTFLLFIWRTRHSSREKHRKIAEAPPPHLRVVHLRNAKDVRSFLETL